MPPLSAPVFRSTVRRSSAVEVDSEAPAPLDLTLLFLAPIKRIDALDAPLLSPDGIDCRFSVLCHSF